LSREKVDEPIKMPSPPLLLGFCLSDYYSKDHSKLHQIPWRSPKVELQGLLVRTKINTSILC